MAGVVQVHLLPSMIEPERLRGAVVVMIDQLRASTTICAALAAGAERVVPCQEAEEARNRRMDGGAGWLAGGEREGVLIPGFDLDNSPRAYTPERVGGKSIAFTTTNGTRALHHARLAERVLVGCLGNVSAASAAASSCAERGAKAHRAIHVLCAGTGGRVTSDDGLAAGAIVSALGRLGWRTGSDEAGQDDDTAMMLAEWWSVCVSAPGGVLRSLLASRGGRNLKSVGLEEDVEFCARVDEWSVVPEFERARGEIRHWKN